MYFDFFTYGGAMFWEDVFFYQRWRIQRHCFSKIYRLLDPWDIRRAQGSFQVCQKKFIKYIESYEIPKQQGDMVVLLHGYGEGKNIFKPLWRKLLLTNSVVAAINYPSLFKSDIESAHQLLFFLNHLPDINKVSFVTKGCGNIILQKLFNLPEDVQSFRKKMRIGNIVQINPITKGYLYCDILSKFKIFRFIFGPMLNNLTVRRIKSLPSLPSQFCVLRIHVDVPLLRNFQRFMKKENSVKNGENSSTKNELYLKGSTFSVLKNQEVLNFTVKFINNGKI